MKRSLRDRLSGLAQALWPPLKARRLDFLRSLEGRTTLPAAPSLRDLLHHTDDLLALEVHYGCFGLIEIRLSELSEIIRSNTMVYEGTAVDVEALDRLWVNLLRLGLFDELVHLVKQYDLPLKAEVKTFLDFCGREYAACRKRGEAYRAKHPDRDIFVMGCIVWGNVYVGNFLRYNIRSMLSAGNLTALAAQGTVVFSIVTDAAGARQIRSHPLFAKLEELGDVEFTIVPDELTAILTSGHLVRNFYVLYGMLDHCSIFFAQGVGSHLFMIPVDSIVADGSLKNMANYRHQGYDCCGGGNLVANTETFLPAIDAMFDAEGPIAISTEDLATLAAAHAHHYFTSQVVAAENQDFGKHPREVFWPIEGGLEIHSVFIHPLFTTASGLARYRRKHYANIDHGMIPRIFAGAGHIKIIEDPSEAYVNNFTAADRLYETTGRPFDYGDFLRAHDNSYPVQRRLFPRAQILPCRLKGWTAYRDVATDSREITTLLKSGLLPPNGNSAVGGSALTVILPTHNRPELAKAQLRFLEASAVRHRVIVADSSEVVDEELRKRCTGRTEYRRFHPRTDLGTKLATVARFVTTPYVATVPDDDVSLPHTIDACLDYLQRNPDYVAAQGYVLRYGASEARLDIHSVYWFIPSIAQSTPLERLYELVRRYQNFFWAVFRTDAFIRATEASKAAKTPLFQELAICGTMALLGKLARLPMIHTLLGEEESFEPSSRAHPLFAFVNDSASFFQAYGQYRDRLVDLLLQLRGKGSARKDKDRLAHTIDVIHASYFGREIDTGVINRSAELLIDDRMDLPSRENLVHGKPTIEPGDVVHLSAVPGYSYIWRNAVLNAEPKSEISISNDEIARVEAALDDYLCSVGSASGRDGKCLTADSR